MEREAAMHGAPQQGCGDSKPGLMPIVNSKPLPSYLALHRHSRSKTEGIVAVADSEQHRERTGFVQLLGTVFLYDN